MKCGRGLVGGMERSWHAGTDGCWGKQVVRPREQRVRLAAKVNQQARIRMVHRVTSSGPGIHSLPLLHIFAAHRLGLLQSPILAREHGSPQLLNMAGTLLFCIAEEAKPVSCLSNRKTAV